MKPVSFISFLIFFVLGNSTWAQTSLSSVDISKDQNGSNQFTFTSQPHSYYVLSVKNPSVFSELHYNQLTIGQEGTMILTEPLAALAPENYQLWEFSKDKPADLDHDGINDLEEWARFGAYSPFNPAKPIADDDGQLALPDYLTYRKLSYKGPEVFQDVQLANLEYVKFFILGDQLQTAKIYFQNSIEHRSHASFKSKTKINTTTGNGEVALEMRGEVIYHPEIKSPNGKLGVFRFQFQPTDDFSFELIEMAQELLAANMPFLKNNLVYYPVSDIHRLRWTNEKEKFDKSRIKVYQEKDFYGDLDYLLINAGESYGILREWSAEKTPAANEIIILNQLPNELPRVAGIISRTAQTPLSHVNLRAIQDRIPNAFVRNLANLDSLIGKFVHYKAEQNGYSLRVSNLHEYQNWLESRRPLEQAVLSTNLDSKKILPLSKINFDDSGAFGAKTCNVAAMRTFGFQEYTIPDGYGIPFYFYDQFMRHNGFYEIIKKLLADKDFIESIEIRKQELLNLQKVIENAPMPEWMLAELSQLQKCFPSNAHIRCRSSSNNEDLPYFNGAGLYTSKTHKPSEGHIAHTIKQVYASLWNLRAFEERSYHRVNHLQAGMGVLCHLSYKDELVNGVALSIDPIYQTTGTFYLNSQIGESLVTNPENASLAEELLIDISDEQENNFSVIRYANLSPNEPILTQKQLNDLRDLLLIIHTRFQKLYKVDSFAVEVEYKIDAAGQLVIKQARPWLLFSEKAPNSQEIETNYLNAIDKNSPIALKVFPNPLTYRENTISFFCPEKALVSMSIFDLNGRSLFQKDFGLLSIDYHDVKFDFNSSSLKNDQPYLLRLEINGTKNSYFKTLHIQKQ